ncbi:cold shock domain-containing protein [Halobaculum sp. WSA2]|uniref:Cold shock domain-containing protein n=1 Tax=Halobaculum saliterrae TaxID=2073113 RepID=A0A6B0T2H1_9EURY|nr:cold shock domain-containing protein [Halobaculum saliterrae]
MQEGTVDYFHETSGYGFIESPATAEDVFFHMTEVGDEDPVVGQRVRFDYEATDEGPRATAMKPVPDSPHDPGGGVETDVDAEGPDAVTPSSTEGSTQGVPDETVSDTADHSTNDDSPSHGTADSPRASTVDGDRSDLRIPSTDDRDSVPRPDPAAVDEPLDVGDLVYLRLSHGGTPLGDRHPFRDSYTVLLGKGDCPELEEALVGQSVGTTGRIEIATTTGEIRMPLRPGDRIEPAWLARLAEDAGVETVREFVTASGDRLTDGELLDMEQLAAKQAELESAVEHWELVAYEVVDAVRWREHGAGIAGQR